MGEKMKNIKMVTWICESKSCSAWRSCGNFCKIEVTGSMVPCNCPFVSWEKPRWIKTTITIGDKTITESDKC